MGERSKPPSVRPGIRLSVRVARGVAAVSSGYQRRGLAPVRVRRSIDPRSSVRDRSCQLSLDGYAVVHVAAPDGAARTIRGFEPRSSGRALSAGYLPFLAVGFARLIDRTETCRFCSRASGLSLRACARSPARRVGGLSSRASPRRSPRWPGSLSRVMVRFAGTYAPRSAANGCADG